METVSVEEDIEKFCGRCKTLVPIGNFHKDKGNRDGLKYACKACVRIYLSVRYKKNKADADRNGTCRCFGCKIVTEVGAAYCTDHFFKNSAHGTLKNSSLWQDIKKLAEKQNYICPLTGDKLIAGVNMSLDHIKPSSKYPHLLQDLNNLQWLSKWANLAKLDWDLDVFIANCVKVAKVHMIEKINCKN